MEKPSERKPESQLIPAVLIIALTLGVFWPTLRAEFLNYDDNVYITENSIVAQGITANTVAAAFAKAQNAGWNPLATLSHMLDVQLFGMNPAAHHAMNVLLHVLNALLLLHVLAAMTGDRTRSAWVAALFAVIPLHVEPVAWISSRKDVLSTLFILLTIDSYMRAVRLPTLLKQTRTLALFVFALLAKPMAITLPLLLLILDFWPLERFGRTTPVLAEKKRAILRCVVEKIPYFTLSLFVAFITFAVQRGGGAVRDLGEFPIGQRIGNAFVTCWMYVADIFWPVGLAPYYPHPGAALSGVAVVLSLLFVLGVSILAMLLLRKAPYIAAGWFWYLVALLPVIGIVQIGSFARADRFAYVPSIGLLMLIVWGFTSIVRQRVLSSVILVLCTLASSWVAYNQVQHWRDSVSLFEHTVAVTKDNAIANSNLGVALLRRAQEDADLSARSADLQAAQRHLEEAIRIAPQFADAHSNLGLALDAQGKPGAREHYEYVLKLDPMNVKALVNLGNVSLAAGNTEEAIQRYSKAKSIHGDDFDACYNLGIAYLNSGRIPEAQKEFLLAVSLRPLSPLAYVQLASAELAGGEAARGEAYAATAIRLEPRNAEAHYQRGVALTLLGNFGPAEKEYRNALELNPEHAMAHYNLGAVLGNMRRLDEAKSEFEKAVQLDPKNAQARQALDMMSQGEAGTKSTSP